MTVKGRHWALEEGVQTVPLKEVAAIKNGQSITRSTATAGRFPVIAGSRGTVAYTHNQSNAEARCLTISKSGHAGFVWWHERAIWASDCIVVRSRDESEYLSYFIYVCMKAKQDQLYARQRDAAQRHVYIRHIEDFPIPCFPVAKQTKITATLDEIVARVDELERNVDLHLSDLRDMRQSLLQKAFAGELAN